MTASLRRTEGRAGQAENGDAVLLIGALQPPSRAGHRPPLTGDPRKCSIRGLTELPLEKATLASGGTGPQAGGPAGGPAITRGPWGRAKAHDHEDDEK